ncbi:MAG: XrtA/PEP-CTERM system TPR-repeat protein PrsT [Pseudomonadota bacterium]
MLHSNNADALARIGTALVVSAFLAACEPTSNAGLLAAARKYQLNGESNAALIQLKNAAELSPNDIAARHMLAEQYLEIGDGLSAEKEIRFAMGRGDGADAALPVLGRALNLQGRFQTMLEESAAAAAAGRLGPALACVRGDAYLGLGKNEAARQLYQSALAAQPKFIAALIGMGRVAILAHQVEEADQYAEQALTAAPRDTDALMFKGDLLRARGRSEQALATYDQVLAIKRQHRSAHIEKAYLLISLIKYPAAQAELDAAREIAPGSVLVAYTQSLLNYSEGNFASAQDAMLSVLRVAPEHMPSVLLAGAISLNLGSLQQAEHHLRHYLEKNPDNLYARKMLASTLLRGGHTPDALAVLGPALKVGSQDVQLLALAGESYMQARDFNRAADLFEKASALDPKAANLLTSLALSKLGKGQQALAISDLQRATRLDASTPQAAITLVRTELGLGHLDKALTAVLALDHAQPGNAAVLDLKGMVHAGMKDGQQARASFLKAQAIQASYFPAAANLAQLELDERHPEAARQALLNFLSNNKTSIEAMTALASIAATTGKMEEATVWLEKASDSHPNAIAPAVNLLAQYLLVRQNGKALNLARKLQVSHPDNPDLLDLLGKSQLANGERDNALETYKRLALALPRSAHAQMQVAALQLLFNNTASAEEFLKTALAMQPDFPAAQLALAELQVRKGVHWKALAIAERMQKFHPKAAAGFQLEGDVLMAQDKPVPALAAFERARVFSNTNELAIKSISALRAAGKAEEGAKRLALWLQHHPDDLRVRLYQAENLLADRQYKLAAAQFESILKQHPKTLVALNNLALAYQAVADGRALAMAEQAYQVAGEQPVVMDTLGWILVDQGDAARGLTLLQKASAQAPQARDIRYHVAVGLYKTGDKAGARKQLEQLAAGNMQFSQADAVRSLLKQLQ